MAENWDKEVFGQFADVGLSLDSALKGGVYKIKQYVAMGHINLVYLAEKKKDDQIKQVLIKEFCPYDYANRDLDKKTLICKGNAFKRQYEDAKKMFERECHIHQKISTFPLKQRRNIVQFLECFEENNTKYLVLEYISGEDLNHYIKSKSGLSFKAIAKEIILAVMQIHNMGIIHKDLKPSNLIVGEDHKIYVIDFGIAEFAEKQQDDSTIFVSKAFSAPELYSKGKVSFQADVYSVGAICYYLLTGYMIPSADERLYEDKVIALSNFITIPWILEWTIMKCLHLLPEKRWSSLWILYVLLR
ncbi:MAG: serine/threonine protein kinase [Clostridiales bacterium]|nr:serine/threonine protein kinase [Clostridiales bacterium]